MLGRSCWPCRREAGIADAGEATGSLWLADPSTGTRGPRTLAAVLTSDEGQAPKASSARLGWVRAPPPRRRRVSRPAALHAGAGLHLVGAEPGPHGPDRGRRGCLSLRCLAAPRAGRPLAGGPDPRVRRARHGRSLLRDLLGARHLRRHPALRAHGPAHGAVHAGAAVPGARGPGDPDAADLPGHPAPLAL